MHDFVRWLQEHDLKATFQRLSILAQIESAGHLDVDEIYAAVRTTHPTISLATVYKNIVTMTDKGVLVEVPIAGHKSKYEIKKHEHVHLICQRCGHVEDRDIDEILIRDTDEIARESAFALHDRQVNLYGVCSACREDMAS